MIFWLYIVIAIITVLLIIWCISLDSKDGATMRLASFLTHILQMDSPVVINWMSPLSFLAVFGVIFISYFSVKFLCANRIAQDGTPRSAASHLGLYCLPMSHKRDTSLI